MKLGQTLGRYKLLERVGRGGMAEVFRAEENLEDGGKRIVAIKRLFPRLAADREFVGMFVNEARIASSMDHPNIVHTYDLINSGSYYYIVMEYLAGMDLEDVVSLSPPGRIALTLHEATYTVHEVALGLGYAHRGGADPNAGPVVHRDISPGNIMVSDEGRVLITDFGIARAAQYAQATSPGVLKGKYEYMAPEYVAGKPFDGRADLFSLGVVFYELLTGMNPFYDVLPKDVWDKILNLDPRPPSEIAREVPKALDELVSKALKKDPDKRIPSGEVFGKVLEPFFMGVSGKPVSEILGKRIRSYLDNAEKGAEQEILSEFLPEDSDSDGVEMTQEIHLDDLLDLVEPKDVPRPDFSVLNDGKDKKKATTVRQKKRLRSLKPIHILFLVGLPLIAGVVTWALWPGDTGYLTVTSTKQAEVFVDGERMGKAPITQLPLVPGKHSIEVRRVGSNRAKSYQRNIAKDEKQEIKVSWSNIHGKGKKKNRWRKHSKRKRKALAGKRSKKKTSKRKKHAKAKQEKKKVRSEAKSKSSGKKRKKIRNTSKRKRKKSSGKKKPTGKSSNRKKRSRK